MNGSPGFITSKLKRPYYLETVMRRRLLTCVQYSGFVFLFLLLFQPFGLSNLPQGILTAAIGYGLTTFMLMSLLNLVVVPFAPSFFSEGTWNVQKELFWNSLNILLIGLGNAFFSVLIGMAPFTLKAILVFELFTIITAIIPVTMTVLLKESRLKNKYEKKSGELNGLISGIIQEQLTPAPQFLSIVSENGKVALEIPIAALLFIQSSDNYVEVYFSDKMQVQKKLLRNSLKAVALQLDTYSQLFRCHKSYLVNIRNVIKVSGNAQGYKLHLPGTEILVPVSRQNNETIQELINAGPSPGC